MDATNGKTIWKKDLDEPNAWATPAIATHDGVTQVITTASKKVRSYNLDNGEIIWEAEGLTGNCTPCPIVDGKVVYCMSGYEGYSLLAIPITAAPKKQNSTRELLVQIAKRELPKDYPGGNGHQPFVDKWFANAPPEKAGRVAQLWKEQEKLFPNMKNRGGSFIRILDYVRSDGKPAAGSAPKTKGNPHIKKQGKADIRRESGKPVGGLYPHTKKTIVKRIIETYKADAVDSWPEYVPPPAPSGMVTKAKITAWEMGPDYESSFHDLCLCGVTWVALVRRRR